MNTFEKVKQIIVDCTGVNGDLIKPDALLDDDIGLDSLDTVEIVMAAEDEFGEIDDATLAVVMTVQDVVDAADKAVAVRKGGAS
ncbi:acyl carrier protein [Rhizobium johnstonii]|uniref:acyl carrier protein n=1 Tax=Rhizobium johnstonii TaxID=3019933 RepID=UPI003F945B83